MCKRPVELLFGAMLEITTEPFSLCYECKDYQFPPGECYDFDAESHLAGHGSDVGRPQSDKGSEEYLNVVAEYCNLGQLRDEEDQQWKHGIYSHNHVPNL